MGVHLRCVDKDKSQKLMEAVHEGVCEAHMNGIILAKKIARQDYFWLTMETDCVRFVKRYHNCQVYGNVSHLPPMELQGMTFSQLFVVWKIDIIGEVRPKAYNGHCYIIVAIDYFSKWVEAELYTTISSKQMARFIEKNII